MTSLIESQKVTAINMAARTYALAPGRAGCEELHLAEDFKTCLQNVAEANININLDKLRNIVEVIEEGILVKI